MLIQGKLLSYGDDLKEAMQIRQKVFVEELGIPEEIEFDDLDSQSIHVVVYEEAPEREKSYSDKQTRAVATGRIYYDGVTCQIDHVAVLKEFRRMKYGDFTVRMLLNKAFTSGINTVEVNSDVSTVEFYQKMGFQSTEKQIMLLGNKYCKMIIRAQDVITICNKCKKI